MLLAGALAFAPLQTLADTTNNALTIRPVLPGLEVSIRGNGNVLVRGAKVASISGSTVTATTTWGSANITWTIRATSSTTIIRYQEGRASLADVRVGDVISFSGTIDQTQGPFTVNAKVIRDWSLPDYSATVRGIVTTVDQANLRFTVLVGSTTITVVATSTTAITENGEASNFSAISVNDSIKATGSYTASTTTLVASKIMIDGVRATREKPERERERTIRIWDSDWFSHWFKRNK